MSHEITLSNITYNNGSERILSSISLSISSSRSIGVLSSNSKETSELLKIVSGINKSFKGHAFIDGKFIDENKFNISYLPPFPCFEENKSIEKLVFDYKKMFPSFSSNLMDSLLLNFQIERKMKIKELNPEQINELAFAFSISKKTSIYVFDDPLKNIKTQRIKDYILFCLKEYIDSSSILIISSSTMDELSSLCDTFVFMNKGKVNLVAEKFNLQEKYNMSLSSIYKEVIK